MRRVDRITVQCVAGLVTVACFSTTDKDEDAAAGGAVTHKGGADDGGDAPGASGGVATSGGAMGTAETCCVDGLTSTCYCPAGVECNFGWFTEFFPDGTCCGQGGPACEGCTGGEGGIGGAGGVSGAGGTAAGNGGTLTGGAGSGGGGVGGAAGAGGEGGGGTWEQCCEEGVTSSCYCEAGVACNFGLDVEFLPGGTCCYTYEDSEYSCNTGGGGAGGNAGAAP
jgi:hypothetical protein